MIKVNKVSKNTFDFDIKGDMQDVAEEVSVLLIELYKKSSYTYEVSQILFNKNKNKDCIYTDTEKT